MVKIYSLFYNRLFKKDVSAFVGVFTSKDSTHRNSLLMKTPNSGEERRPFDRVEKTTASNETAWLYQRS